MAKPPLLNNPPPIERLRLVVKARDRLPKKFIWEIIKENPQHGTIILDMSSPKVFDTMEAAYDHGKPVLQKLRARENSAPENAH